MRNAARITLLGLACLTTTLPAYGGFDYKLFRPIIWTAGILTLVRQGVLEIPLTVSIAHSLGVHTEDLVTSLAYSAICFQASRFAQYKTALFLQSFGILAPLIGLLLPTSATRVITTLPVLRSYYAITAWLKNIPVIGNFIRCPNKECSSVCNDCCMMRTMQTLPAAAGILFYIIPQIKRRYFSTPFVRTTLQPVPLEETCCICQSTYQELYDEQHDAVWPVRLFPCQHHLCNSCAHEHYFVHRKKTCPLCRTTTDVAQLQLSIQSR